MSMGSRFAPADWLAAGPLPCFPCDSRGTGSGSTHEPCDVRGPGRVMRGSLLIAALFGGTLLAGLLPTACADSAAALELSIPPPLEITPERRGLNVRPRGSLKRHMHLWFWEWNVFDAIAPGVITSADETYFSDAPNEDRAALDKPAPGVKLTATQALHGVDLVLEVRNTTTRDWPALASLVPCFHPGWPGNRSKVFDTRRTWFYGTRGLEPIADSYAPRALHFNRALHGRVDRRMGDERLSWTNRWPTSRRDATRGLVVRESRKRANVATGIAWERFLFVQANNPKRGMHLAVRVGPLASGEKRTIRGKIYLVTGNRYDVLERYFADFGGG